MDSKILALVAKTLDVSEDRLHAAFVEAHRKFPSFSTKKAKELYDALDDDDKDTVVPSRPDGKFSVDDIKRASGDISSSRKEASEFSSKEAAALAKDKTLKASDFSKSERSGRVLKSGLVQITKDDVRKKSGTFFGEFSTPKVARRAYEAGLTVKDFPGVERITSDLLEKKINSKKNDD